MVCWRVHNASEQELWSGVLGDGGHSGHWLYLSYQSLMPSVTFSASDAPIVLDRTASHVPDAIHKAQLFICDSCSIPYFSCALTFRVRSIITFPNIDMMHRYPSTL